MRHVVAALVSGRALASGHREPDAEAPAENEARRRLRRSPWAWLAAVWTAARPGG